MKYLTASAAVLGLALTALPVQAQEQSGLVNVAVGNVNVQVPVAVAANVCNVPVSVLAQEVSTGDATCDADPAAAAANKQFVQFAERQGVELPAG